MLLGAALTLAIVCGHVAAAPSTSNRPVFNVANPAKTPTFHPPPSPVHLAPAALETVMARMGRNKAPRSLDDVVAVDDIFKTILPRQTTTCVDSTANETVINSLFYYGGADTVVSLCPGARILITNPIFFTAARQVLTTQGMPTDSTRATLVVMGADQSCAIYGPCDACTGIALRNVQIDGNRGGLGWMHTGLGLVEMGGNAPGQIIDNVHAYEPRGWSVLHGIEGWQNMCRGMIITNNQIGPAGHAPNTGFQFKKRDSTGNYGAGQWADGISIACFQSTVSNNVIIDATDGAIVCFTCASTIKDNTIISSDRQLLGGINMVDWGPNIGNYEGTVVSGNRIIAENNFIKIGIAIGGMSWGSDNRTAARTFGGTVSDNVLSSGPGGYFGFGISLGGHNGATVTGNSAPSANFGGQPSNVCFKTLIPASQAFIVDRTNTPGSTVQAEFLSKTVVFLICQEPGPIVGVGLSAIVANITSSPSGESALVPPGDIALNATATASTWVPSQPPSAANDGIIAGYNDALPNPAGAIANEWCSNGERSNAWLLLTWQQPVLITSVILYDRPNLFDFITAAMLTFSDGSNVSVSALNNDGSAKVVNFPARVSKTLRMTVISAASSTYNSGLAEIVVFGSLTPPANVTSTSAAAANSTIPVSSSLAVNATVSATASATVNATSTVLPTSTSSTLASSSVISSSASSSVASSTTTSSTLSSTTASSTLASVSASASVSLNVSSTATSTKPLSSSTVISATATSTKPISSSAVASSSSTKPLSSSALPTTSTKPVSVSASVGVSTSTKPASSSAVSSSTIRPTSTTSSSAPIPTATLVNLALRAQAFSSGASAVNQQPSKAIDNVTSGFPLNPNTEWASVNGKVNTWLLLRWSGFQTMNQVVLYDRPNLNDQITSAVLTFSDKSTIQITALNNNGSATTFNFPSRSSNSLMLTVRGVSPSTSSVGLSEIQVFNNPFVVNGQLATTTKSNIVDLRKVRPIGGRRAAVNE